MTDLDNNIQFNYLYRDAGNWKLFNSIVFSNPDNLSIDFIETKIRERFIAWEFFNPVRWGIPKLEFDDYDEQLDYDLHEFESIELTNKESDSNISITDFLKRVSDPNLNQRV